LALLARKKRIDAGKIGGQTVDASIMERYGCYSLNSLAHH
jgi:hypothetical protein